MITLIVPLAIAAFVLLALARTVRIVPQARAGVVERLGRYQRTLMPGLALVVPFVDRLRPRIDLREQVVSFAPQPVITEDNLVVNIDPKLLAYQYLQMLPQIAQGDSNKVWMIPSEFSHALERFQERFTTDTNGKAPIPPITKHLAGER